MKFHVMYVILVVVLAIMPHNSMSCSLDLPEEFAKLVGAGEADAAPGELPSFDTLVANMATELKKHQFYVNERIRTEGHSGMKKIRMRSEGTRPYHAPTHTGRTFGDMHNHANTRDRIGLGEMSIVMDGAEFHTKHGDYNLMTRSPSGGGPFNFEPIEMPGVPEEVTSKATVEEQIAEMQEWFKAWALQDSSQGRDYTQYFKPVLCYIEGAWFYEAEADDVDSSEFRFLSASGNMDSRGRYEFLPSRIVDVIDGKPVYAQWKYNKLCQPLKEDIPFNRYRAIDDLATRLRLGMTYEEYANSSAARFQINPIDKPRWTEHMTARSYVDDLIEQIPGMDGYGADLNDDAFNLLAREIAYNEDGENPVLNTANYHRWYKVAQTGAMGSNIRHRGFNDENLFMAMTTYEGVVPSEAELCESRTSSECATYTQRWSYLLPIEVIYLTPLSSWNPYSLMYKGEKGSDGYDSVAAGRNGGPTAEDAFDGVNSDHYFITPAEFFDGNEINTGMGDTTRYRGPTSVLDLEGNVQTVRDSGIRILFPSVAGLGPVRQRYAILPVHGEGGSAYKELEALKDVILEPLRYGDIYRQRQQVASAGQQDVIYPFILMRHGTDHYHEVNLHANQYAALHNGEDVDVKTESTNGHQHELTLSPVVNQWQQLRIKITTLSPYQNHNRNLAYKHYCPPEQMTND